MADEVRFFPGTGIIIDVENEQVDFFPGSGIYDERDAPAVGGGNGLKAGTLSLMGVGI